LTSSDVTATPTISNMTLTTIKNAITKRDTVSCKFGKRLCESMLNTIDRDIERTNVLKAHLKFCFFMLYYILRETKIGQIVLF